MNSPEKENKTISKIKLLGNIRTTNYRTILLANKGIENIAQSGQQMTIICLQILVVENSIIRMLRGV